MLISIGVAAYFYFMTDPAKSKKCAFGCNLTAQRAPWMNGPDCISVEEKVFDASIPAPNQMPYLSDFSYSAGAGNAFCNPAWYAFRYVRNSDGAYGPLSPWSGTDPTKPKDTPLAIYGCASQLPCIPSATTKASTQTSPTSPTYACAQNGIPTGSATSTFNVPTIALIEPLNIDTKYSQKDGYTMNVHRQVGYIDNDGKIHDFDPTAEGDIVGSFLENPGHADGHSGSIYAQFSDRVFWPQSNQQSSCGC